MNEILEATSFPVRLYRFRKKIFLVEIVSGSEQSLPPLESIARLAPSDPPLVTHTRCLETGARCRRLELSARDNGTALSLVTLPRLLFALHVYVGHSLFAHPAVSILLFLV